MKRIPAIGTLTVLFVCVVMFLAFDLNARDGGHQLAAGAASPIRIALGEYWRILGANFVHFGLLHLACNGYFIYRLGPFLEAEIGTERFLLLFLFSGICGTCLASLLMPFYGLLAGASCSLFGILGALVAIGIRRGHGVADFFSSPAGKSILSMILINLMIGWMFPAISNTGHIGGLVGGFLLTMFWFKFPSPGLGMRRGNVPGGIALLLLLAAMIFLLIHPYHQPWYQARQYWFADDERAAVLGDALEARGFSEESVDLLAALRDIRIRSAQGSIRVEDLTEIPLNKATVKVLGEMGIDIRRFAEFFTAIDEGNPEAGDLFPQDPWQAR